MLAEPATRKTRKLVLGKLITAFLSNEDKSFRVKESFLKEIRRAINDYLLLEKGTTEVATPMEVAEWGEDFAILREKSALDFFKQEADPRDIILSDLARLNDNSVNQFVKALTDTLIEVYKNANS